MPISIQALTGETLTQLNVTTFDDYLKFVPNVTSAGYGPGQNSIFMRGLSAGASGSKAAAPIATSRTSRCIWMISPAQLPGRNLDIYAADIERIEVLEGPAGHPVRRRRPGRRDPLHHQQAETRRDRGQCQCGLRLHGHGDPNSSLDATLNLPLVPDTLRCAR